MCFTLNRSFRFEITHINVPLLLLRILSLTVRKSHPSSCSLGSLIWIIHFLRETLNVSQRIGDLPQIRRKFPFIKSGFPFECVTLLDEVTNSTKTLVVKESVILWLFGHHPFTFNWMSAVILTVDETEKIKKKTEGLFLLKPCTINRWDETKEKRWTTRDGIPC